MVRSGRGALPAARRRHGGVTLKLDEIVARLAAAGCVAAEDEAAELLAAAATASTLDAMVERRVGGEPLAWIVGGVDFCGLRIAVRPGVYVPRWQTEPLARQAAALVPPHGVAVDLCTGAGAIAAVLRRAAPAATVIATDIDPAAVECARANGIDARLGSLDDALPGDLAGAVDVMTAVVPYVPSEALHLLPRDVLAFEPPAALDGGPEGTRLLLEMVERAPRWLRPGGWLLLELGGDQSAAIGAAMREGGFDGVAVHADDDGDERSIEGRWRELR